ncbi:MAG: hypothetical protein JWN62_3256 [Acidimicrobiales bacterium]|nr:hypothetical protein [Acidimicrobiales bacterium]
MAELILGPMLRHVDETSATIWMETDAPCSVRVLDCETRTFSVAGHHYALVILEGLAAATVYEYAVALDGEQRWPDATSALPASVIRTHRRQSGHEGQSARVVFGSCRTAAPHIAPWALELSLDVRGRGVDALYAYAFEMARRPIEEWPDLAVFLGDQIYADDSSPQTRARVHAARAASPPKEPTTLPDELVDGFEQFTWLYQESWSPELERWFLANVPSVMVFDDHEMIDDWNISADWVADIRRQPWWEDHVIGGLMTYWLYQHLGNLSPQLIREEGLLAELVDADDGEAILHRWAMGTEEFTPVPGGYRFNFVRDIGRIRLVMLDARNGRVLEPGQRRIIDDDEWRWVVEACSAPVDHLMIGTSVPAFVARGMHDLQVWNEAMSDGRWGRLGRRIGELGRIKADMEDWPSFNASFEALSQLLVDVGRSERPNAPQTIAVLSGDIHFSYASQIRFPSERPMHSTVHQLVNSPIRNALTGPERTAMHLGLSRVVGVVGRVLRRCVGRRRTDLRWQIDQGPVFDNSLGELTYDGPRATSRVLHTRPYDERAEPALDTAFEIDLVAGSASRRSTLPLAATLAAAFAAALAATARRYGRRSDSRHRHGRGHGRRHGGGDRGGRHH